MQAAGITTSLGVCNMELSFPDLHWTPVPEKQNYGIQKLMSQMNMICLYIKVILLSGLSGVMPRSQGDQC